jgi:hypothetical protein
MTRDETNDPEPEEGLDEPEIPVDVPEADAAEQYRPWEEGEKGPRRPKIPPDAPEADVLEQSRDADLEADDHDA